MAAAPVQEVNEAPPSPLVAKNPTPRQAAVISRMRQKYEGNYGELNALLAPTHRLRRFLFPIGALGAGAY